MRFEPQAQVQIATLHAIGDDPGKRNPCSPQALNHPLGQLTFGVKADGFWNASLPATPRIVDPFLGQIEFAVKKSVSFFAHITQEHANLTILNGSGSPAILLFHSG